MQSPQRSVARCAKQKIYIYTSTRVRNVSSDKGAVGVATTKNPLSELIFLTSVEVYGCINLGH